MSDKILVPLVNWRRKANIPVVLDALRKQTVPVHIAIIECSPNTEFALPRDVLDQADIVFSVNHNIGPPSRFIPPLMLYEYEYTFFTVDDHVPGPRCIEWMLDTARMLNGEFATIGQDGRRIVDGDIVRRRGRMQPNRATPVDVITSCELCRTRDIKDVLRYRDHQYQDYGREFPAFEDDLILCLGLQMIMRQRLDKPVPCYLTPEPPNELYSWRMRKLHAPHAMCARPEHHEVRKRFIAQATEMGWRSAVPFALEAGG